MGSGAGQIKTDLQKRTELCDALTGAGAAVNEEKAAKLDVGEISGMPGVDTAVAAYQALQQLYSKFGELAKADAEKMLTIAKEFDRLDSSAG